MARPKIDLKTKLLSLLDHTGEMPVEAAEPLAHYTFGVNRVIGLRKYFINQMDKADHNPVVRNRHLHVLDNMILVQLVQAFERFIKDVAAVCVNRLCERVDDERFDQLSVKGGHFAAHFSQSGSSPGKALCESDTWLNCRQINEQFRRFLGDPTDPKRPPHFHVFLPGSDELRFMNIVWQLRHTLVHNVGVITRTDSAKLRVHARKSLPSPRVLKPTWDDVRYLRAYLDERARDINVRVGKQLAAVLTSLHASDPSLFIAQTEADALSVEFAVSLVVAGATGVILK